MSADGQRTEWRRNIVENFNRPSRAHDVTDRRQTTDGRTTTYSEREREREREFTFAKNQCTFLFHNSQLLKAAQFTRLTDGGIDRQNSHR